MRATAIALALLFIAVSALAEIPKPSDDFWYLDSANVLSSETEGEIFFANQSLYNASGAEIVVVCVDTTGNLSTQDYAYELFTNWNIGKNSYLGMLLVMAIDDDDYYSMFGTRLETLISAGDLDEMLKTYLEPDFAAKDYDAGARKFFEAAYTRVCSELNLNLNVEDAKRKASDYIQKHTTADMTAVRSEHETVPEERFEEQGRRLADVVDHRHCHSFDCSWQRVSRCAQAANVPPIRRSLSRRWAPRPHRNPPPPPMGGFGGRPPMGGRPPRHDSSPRRGGFAGEFSGGRSGGSSGGLRRRIPSFGRRRTWSGHARRRRRTWKITLGGRSIALRS